MPLKMNLHLKHFLQLYTKPRILAIGLLGFSSGLPLALTFGTLSLWLSEAGISKTSIGLFALTGAPYTFKFLWSPLVDQMPIPYLTQKLGRRRSWILTSQIGLLVSILALGDANPAFNPSLTALFAILTAFCSATQDISIDAYRVEILEKHQYGAGAAMIVLGYRLGMLVSGAGALYLASYWGWTTTYWMMACLVPIGMITTLLNPEPISQIYQNDLNPLQQIHPSKRWISSLKKAVVDPFTDFIRRPGWLLILSFILLYKFGDALAGVMNNPFFIEIGFTKIEIANISKAFGMVSSIVGSFIGGIMISRIGIYKTLLICGILQMLSNLMFVLQAMVGHHVTLLALTIALENLSGGMGSAAFVAYLSSLCNLAYTATQYALLSSSEHLPWTLFFLLTTLAALPGLGLLIWMQKKMHNKSKPNPSFKRAPRAAAPDFDPRQ
ncbi:MAG: AmpG family muropeptide MFS transporter [Magnetococcus sp. DMHC-6]